MFDLIVLVAGGLLAVRGWRRGLLRQLATLLPFALGLLIVVRLTPGWATVVEEWLGIPYGAALFLVGLALFAAVGIGGWMVLHALARVARFPGLNTADRVAGAILGVVWLVIGIMALTWFASFLSLPDNVTSMLSESSAVERIAGTRQPTAPGSRCPYQEQLGADVAQGGRFVRISRRSSQGPVGRTNAYLT